MHTTYQTEHGARAILTDLDTVEIDDMWGTTETIAALIVGDDSREYRVLDMSGDDLTCENDAGEEIYMWRLA